MKASEQNDETDIFCLAAMETNLWACKILSSEKLSQHLKIRLQNMSLWQFVAVLFNSSFVIASNCYKL